MVNFVAILVHFLGLFGRRLTPLKMKKIARHNFHSMNAKLIIQRFKMVTGMWNGPNRIKWVLENEKLRVNARVREAKTQRRWQGRENRDYRPIDPIDLSTVYTRKVYLSPYRPDLSTVDSQSEHRRGGSRFYNSAGGHHAELLYERLQTCTRW